MLELNVSPKELFDERTQTFVDIPGCVVQLEHSLVSLSRWETRWEKPFLDGSEHSLDELVDYIHCMVVGTPPEQALQTLSPGELAQINDYIAKPSTATKVASQAGHSARQIVTSEVIYGWMVAYRIPWEAQHWHLNRLLTLIRVCDAQQNPKKQKRFASYDERMALNLERQRKLGTHG